PRSLTSLTASSLNSRLNLRLSIKTLQFQKHLNSVSSKPAAAQAMALPEAKTLDLGALAAVYYSVDDHVKVGVGYNFAGFSDDLRDLERDHQGVFFNIMAKY
ncbi:hypothetical protein, partial [Devosia sp. MC532]|uniref:hypothetical protein n=1 Tax=Devosia sp. MC532 TaxID=2799788 RepID=UPI001AEE0554